MHKTNVFELKYALDVSFNKQHQLYRGVYYLDAIIIIFMFQLLKVRASKIWSIIKM